MRLAAFVIKPLFAILVLLGSQSHAESVTIKVVDQKGRPLEGAVVYVTGGAQKASTGMTHTINQRGEKFSPFVLAIAEGDKVVFQNSDTIAHHVYSFSNVMKLNTVVGGGNASEPFEASKNGIVAIGCNIHDNMAAFIHIAPNATTAMTDAQGVVLLDVPDGSTKVHAWHPRMPGREAINQPYSADIASVVLRVRPGRGDPQQPRRDRRSY